MKLFVGLGHFLEQRRRLKLLAKLVTQAQHFLYEHFTAVRIVHVAKRSAGGRRKASAENGAHVAIDRRRNNLIL